MQGACVTCSRRGQTTHPFPSRARLTKERHCACPAHLPLHAHTTHAGSSLRMRPFRTSAAGHVCTLLLLVLPKELLLLPPTSLLVVMEASRAGRSCLLVVNAVDVLPCK